MAAAHVRPGTRVGLVGLGRMGAPIAATLSRTFPVDVFDIDASHAGVVPGARWCTSLDGLARSSDVLITVLPGPTELRQCVTAALPALRPGALWIDLTSGDPAVTRVLAGIAGQRGVAAVAAPMGGSISDAIGGALVFYVGGDDEDVARAAPVLKPLAAPDGIRRAGDRPEDGHVVKLLANGLWFANALAAAEAMLIGTRLGVDTDRLHGLLRTSAGGSRFLSDHLDALLDGDYLTTFGIDRVVEELDTISRLRDTAGVTTPILDASARLHHAALDQFGPVLGELLGVKLLEEHAGGQLRHTSKPPRSN